MSDGRYQRLFDPGVPAQIFIYLCIGFILVAVSCLTLPLSPLLSPLVLYDKKDMCIDRCAILRDVDNLFHCLDIFAHRLPEAHLCKEGVEG